eukprot:GDKI01010799.1.p1 GENE.GDKI01010799.1~~GDKI01010799.1.p1  ORF type:complete len:125 (+),score=28.78 GDKI01010799.1:1-375(+)
MGKRAVAEHSAQQGLPAEAVRVELVQMSPTVPFPLASSDSNGIMCADGYGQPVWPPVGVNVVIDMHAMSRWRNTNYVKPVVPMPMVMAPAVTAAVQQQPFAQQQQNAQAGIGYSGAPTATNPHS